MPSKKKKQSTDSNGVKSLFDHVNHIHEQQTLNYFSTLIDSDKRTYSNYMVNRILSMNIHLLPLVDEIQQYTLDPAVHYLFYATTIPRGKQYNKYVKSKTKITHEPWLIELVAKHFQVSQEEAVLYIDIYYKKNTAELRAICEAYAVDQKLIKKAKL